MKIYQKILLLCGMLMLVPALAQADEKTESKADVTAQDTGTNAAVPMMRRHIRRMMPQQNCPMQENANMSVSFNFRADSLKEAKEKFDSHIGDIDALIKQSKSGQWNLQSMNYSVSEQGGDAEPKFMINGNANYQTDSADEAFSVMEQLTAKKMHVSVNVNKFRNCAMQNYVE